jgi:hypothetical protein
MDEQSPEDVLFDFLIANLGGNEDKIRALIVSHPDAALLWQGAYPPDVAEDAPHTVLLRSSASPIPLAVVRVSGGWTLRRSSSSASRHRVTPIRVPSLIQTESRRFEMCCSPRPPDR